MSTHLMFDGHCRAAFQRYQQVLGGTVNMLSFGDSPLAADVASRWHDRIVHATLSVAGVELAGADVLPEDYSTPQGFAVLLAFGNPDQAQSVFDEFADGGEIRYPFQKTFWSSGFGVVVDKFAIPWEVTCEGPPAE
ncbi:MAG TPA: VOC family protein [Gammaproteobacteria bacterium]|nr:VOC family protein [Gammaproteobacteria bacterium]